MGYIPHSEPPSHHPTGKPMGQLGTIQGWNEHGSGSKHSTEFAWGGKFHQWSWLNVLQQNNFVGGLVPFPSHSARPSYCQHWPRGACPAWESMKSRGRPGSRTALGQAAGEKTAGAVSCRRHTSIWLGSSQAGLPMAASLCKHSPCFKAGELRHTQMKRPLKFKAQPLRRTERASPDHTLITQNTRISPARPHPNTSVMVKDSKGSRRACAPV